MNLMRNNNLFDVYNIFTTRNNLMMKSCTMFDSNNVNIECDSIIVESLKLNNPIEDDSFIQCDAFGVLRTEFDTNGIPSWLKPNTQDIDVTIFNNDMNVLTYDTLCNIALTGDYHSLSNKPYLWDHHNSNEYCKIESNLEDVYNMNTLYDLFEFNEYAKCNIDPMMSFSNIHLNNIDLVFLLNRSGILDNTMNNILNPTLIPYVTNTQFGLGLITNNPRATDDISTSFYFNTLFNELNDQYNSKNENYSSNVTLVVNYLIENIATFTNFRSNLSDINQSTALDVLELTNIMSKISVSEDTIHAPDLIINMVVPYQNKFYWGSIFPSKINDKYVNIENPLNVTRDIFFYIRFNRDIDLLVDSNININEYFDIEYIQNDYSDFPLSTLTNLGILKLYENKNENNIEDTNNTFNFNVFRSEYFFQENKLETVVDIIDFQAFLETLYATGVDNGSNLLKFTCNLEEISNLSFNRKLQCYANLELQPIVHTSDYDTLFNIPNFLSCFSNDSEFISAYNNFNEFVTLEEKSYVRSNLNVGTLGVQNIENVLMFGSNLSMDFLTVNSTLTFGNINIDSSQDYYMKSLDNDGTMVWNVLPEYDNTNVEQKGIVHMFNQLNPDDNSTYSIGLLNNIHNELKGLLNTIQTDINTIRSTIQS
jgi:hypothetical protein